MLLLAFVVALARRNQLCAKTWDEVFDEFSRAVKEPVHKPSHSKILMKLISKNSRGIPLICTYEPGIQVQLLRFVCGLSELSDAELCILAEAMLEFTTHQLQVATRSFEQSPLEVRTFEVETREDGEDCLEALFTFETRPPLISEEPAKQNESSSIVEIIIDGKLNLDFLANSPISFVETRLKSVDISTISQENVISMFEDLSDNELSSQVVSLLIRTFLLPKVAEEKGAVVRGMYNLCTALQKSHAACLKQDFLVPFITSSNYGLNHLELVRKLYAGLDAESKAQVQTSFMTQQQFTLCEQHIQLLQLLVKDKLAPESLEACLNLLLQNCTPANVKNSKYALCVLELATKNKAEFTPKHRETLRSISNSLITTAFVKTAIEKILLEVY